MKITNILTLCLVSFSLASCLYAPVRFDSGVVDQSGHTNYPGITSADKSNIQQLAADLMSLSSSVDPAEANLVAYEAILYPKILANRYQLVSPPNYHNQMVNAGMRKRGLCYHFAEDIMAHLDRPYKTLQFERLMAYQGQYLEHNVPSVRAKGQPLSEAIILDAWRESANLIWMKAKDDEAYPWEKFYYPK